VRVPRPSLRSTFIAVAVALVGLHLVSVTLEALPPNRYSEVLQDQTAYVDPYFTQNWRLFAPNPVAEDRNLLFQGAYRAADGSVVETEWVDWTAIELDLVRHRLVGGRAGYVTTKLVTPLRARTAALSDVQRAIALAPAASDPPSFAALGADLRAAGTPPVVTDLFVRYEQVTTRLASDVLAARWPGRDLVAVRYAVRRHGVVPFAARDGSPAERAASRPTPVEETGGWRRPVPGPAAERAVVRRFYRDHR
jgi:hypothetical protein